MSTVLRNENNAQCGFTFDSGPPIQAGTIQAERFRPDDSGQTRFRPVTIQAGHDSGPS